MTENNHATQGGGIVLYRGTQGKSLDTRPAEDFVKTYAPVHTKENPRNITQPLPIFLSVLLNARPTLVGFLEDPHLLDWIEVPDYYASILEALDPEENFIHIEWPEDKARPEGSEIRNPVVHRVESWKSSYVYWKSLRDKAAEARSKRLASDEKNNEILVKLVSGVMEKTGFDRKTAETVAAEWLRSGNFLMVKQFSGIELE